jgi:hypothetical protein
MLPPNSSLRALCLAGWLARLPACLPACLLNAIMLLP